MANPLFDEIAPPSLGEGKQQRSPDVLMGLIAVWLGMMMIVMRGFQALALFLSLVSPVFLIGYISGGAAGLSDANLLLSPFTISFLGYVFFVFLLPAYFDVVRLGGFFFQRSAWVRPGDTIGAVNRRWEQIKQDGTRIWRYWRARP